MWPSNICSSLWVVPRATSKGYHKAQKRRKGGCVPLREGLISFTHNPKPQLRAKFDNGKTISSQLIPLTSPSLALETMPPSTKWPAPLRLPALSATSSVFLSASSTESTAADSAALGVTPSWNLVECLVARKPVLELRFRYR